jgi:UDP-N-acetylmuramoyl-L-alanyl-D-glutamate--2,6-diaminopimelate ligase
LSDILAPALNVDPDIGGLTADSRRVKPGDLFAALPGSKADGRAYLADALAKGAAAVLAPLGTMVDDERVALVTDDNPRRRFALMAARFYGAQPSVMAAVTGTNGKTSVAHFTRQIWSRLGHAAASLGTLGLTSPNRVEPGSLTTPDPVALHRTLADLVGEGVTHAAFEASSHGLDQFRLDGVDVAAAAFTNLTRDHLDYHGTMVSYWRAKRRLFAEVMPPRRAAVINADVGEGRTLVELCRSRRHRVITYGAAGVDVRVVRAVASPLGQDLTLSVFDKEYQVRLPLAGTFQASNVACALGLALATGCDAPAAVAALESLEGVPGRLQKAAATPGGAAIYVDYAHTPDALETILAALRPHARGRLVVLFGCGGDRDVGKRPLMGAIAAQWADLVFVTDDNPRSEIPSAIRSQILAACPVATEIGDRREAIRAAVRALRPDDLLVIAGKGHETGQIVGDRTLPFDDAVEARLAAEEPT